MFEVKKSFKNKMITFTDPSNYFVYSTIKDKYTSDYMFFKIILFSNPSVDSKLQKKLKQN